MTYKDAAAIIDRILDEDRHLYTEKAVNALEMGKDALLKLEPTPCVKVKNPDCIHPLLEERVCPTCGVHLCAYELIDTTNCPVCGQRLAPYNKNIGDKDDD